MMELNIKFEFWGSAQEPQLIQREVFLGQQSAKHKIEAKLKQGAIWVKIDSSHCK